MKKYKSKWRAENKASRIAPNHTEIDETLLDLIEQFDEADTARQKAGAEKKSKIEEELVQTQNMRNASPETVGDTRKRKQNDTTYTVDYISYFYEKHEGNFIAPSELKIKNKSLIYRLYKCSRHNRLSRPNSCLFTSRVQSC